MEAEPAMPRIRWNRRILSHGADETRALAGALLRETPGSVVIALHGELGAGKTCFVQGLAMALDIRRPVASPTFIIVNQYPGTRRLCHMDFYRLTRPEDALALGFEEFLAGGGVVAIEWPEKVGDLLPPNAVHVTLEPGPDPDTRWIRIRRSAADAAPPTIPCGLSNGSCPSLLP